MNKMLMGLLAATLAVVLVLLGFLLGSGWNKPSTDNNNNKGEQNTNNTTNTNNTSGTGDKDKPKPPPPPPPPPPPVPDHVRVRESLKPGKTYRVATKLAFNMRGTDHDWWVVNSTITVNYWATAEIDRKIESNDGRTIVELRTFRKVTSSKLDTKLESVRIDLGAAGDFLLGGVVLLQPEAAPFVAGARQVFDGADVSKLMKFTGIAQDFVANMVNRDPQIRCLSSAGGLQGKKVRLTYRNEDGAGVQVEPVDCALTDDEKHFLASSVLLSDSLIFPDTGIKEGQSWDANSMYFIGLIDPSMMLRPEGNVRLERGPNVLPPPRSGQKQELVKINVIGGELTFHESNSASEQAGYFRPQKGHLLFSDQDKMFIESQLHGRGKLTITQKNHILFQARSNREPELKIHYTCRIVDNPEN